MKFMEHCCNGKQLACDRLMDGLKSVSENLRYYRRALMAFEQISGRILGQTAVHARKATGRAITPGDLTEQEIAGQISHRLWHRGAEPVALSVMADGRSRWHRQAGATAVRVHRSCVLTLTARK